jgi:GT2 family glycosyltransferase
VKPRGINRPAVADAVTVAYVHSTDVAHSWYRSMTDLLMCDIGTHQRILRGGYIAVRYSTGGIIQARNDAARMFLESRESEWLFWSDTDMGFAPDTVERLLASADAKERPIVGGLCFGSKELNADGVNGYWTAPVPTIYDWVTTPEGVSGFMPRHGYESDTLTQCSGTGSACIIVHRSVYDKLGPNPYTPLRNPSTGELLGEDLSFCARAAEHDIPIYVDASVKTSHLKPIWMAEEQFKMWAHR